MINGKTVLAIIPARGGSKGLPGKNIKLLAGKPLIAWTIEEAKKSKYIDRLILSSDDDEIISVASEWSCEVPFKRPAELAKDDTPGIEPVLHAIETLKEKYDYVCLLQPTSPLRKVEHIDGCIEKCANNDADSCVSVTEVDKSPYWMYRIDKNDRLTPLLENNLIKRRQDLPNIYTLNGAVYAAKSNFVIQAANFIGNNTSYFVMSKSHSLDIDNETDFNLAKFFINNHES
ncbi:MAG: acylneuraminate cytidylyltransferase family protein [Ignavibacteriaceae bacterium]|nr:acylneuraminate cytidylyltransferase family protein [Ignavibacteriaceae bacterium]